MRGCVGGWKRGWREFSRLELPAVYLWVEKVKTVSLICPPVGRARSAAGDKLGKGATPVKAGRSTQGTEDGSPKLNTLPRPLK